ncbi:MAG TPA: hypothetical protein VKA97_02275, partial [Pyrinomonadaceae bacterium]|nr:hypothetical protein [Pyrinomonadaceae bacterium]
LSGLDVNFDHYQGRRASRLPLASISYISRRWRCVATFGAKPCGVVDTPKALASPKSKRTSPEITVVS